MASDRTYHIRAVLDGQTLAAGLRGLIAGLSWADARRLIGNRHVQVNGNLSVDEARRLKAGDVVKVFDQPRAPVPTSRDVRVVYLDDDLVVVDKPAGMTTLRHAEEREWDDRRKQRQPTLEEVLQEMLPGLIRDRRPDPPGGGGAAPAGARPRAGHPLANRQPGPTARGPQPGRGKHPLMARGGPEHAPHAKGRSGKPHHPPRKPPHGSPPPSPIRVPKVRPVHRLDRDTSGLMLFALTPRAEQALVAMFKAHDVRRAYHAVVHGSVDAPARYESWFVRDRGDGLRGSAPDGQATPDAKHAVTHVKPLRPLSGGAYTVVECRLETGRTHQIRIHLSEASHMLCGEKVYTRPTVGSQPVSDTSGAPRHALHSAELEFTHPTTGKPMHFTSRWPKDLAQWLEGLG